MKPGNGESSTCTQPANGGLPTGAQPESEKFSTSAQPGKAKTAETLTESDGNVTQPILGTEPGIDNQRDSSLFQQRLHTHFLHHSRGSSINLSFDLSSSSSSSIPYSENPGDVFREHILGNPDHVRMYIKEKLRYHFMSPLEKWRYRHVFPWKLVFQIIKIFVVTFQILLFGTDSTQFYKDEAATATALKTYFLQDWDPIRDVYFYPPTAGPFAVYTLAELCDSINIVIQNYANVTKEPIGSFKYDSDNGSLVPPELCLEYYDIAEVFPFNSSVDIHDKIRLKCFLVKRLSYQDFSIEKFLNETDLKLDIERLISVKISFTLRTLYRRSRSVVDYFGNYALDTRIIYKNNHQDGMVEVVLELSSEFIKDEGFSYKDAHSIEMIVRQVLNVLAITLCVISLNLCTRSIRRCFALLRKTKEFFKTCLNVELSFADLFEFIDCWLCLIVLNDILVTVGTVINISIDLQMASRMRFMYASVFLGTGLLLVWCGVIRYLGYLRTYNLLTLTLKRAMPNLLKFLTAAIILFLGYAVCGWAILGPYHMKFKTFSTTMECLYSITNGDDIFATFSLATTEYGNYRLSKWIWWFTRFYLYSFVILFICVVINLLYAVIIDAFEAIKELSDANPTEKKSLVRDFIDERFEQASSTNYLIDEEIEGRMRTLEAFTCCWPCPRSDSQFLLDDDNFEFSEEAIAEPVPTRTSPDRQEAVRT